MRLCPQSTTVQTKREELCLEQDGSFKASLLPLQREKGVKEADGSKENREDQPGQDQRETSG